MNVSLVMVSSDGKSREIPLQKLPATLGRGEDCKVRIPVASVSRRHCELKLEDDEFVVKDLKSSNGTFVNGERVSTRELIPGDLLAVGPLVFVVRIDGHPKDVDPVESYVAGAVDVGGPPGGPTDDAISGVPTWSGQAPGGRAGGGKPGGKEEVDDGLNDLLADLDLDDEDEEPPKKK